MVQTCQQVDGSPAAPMVWVHRYKKQVFLFLVVSLSFAYVFICRSRRLDVNTVFDASSQFSYGNMWLKNLSADACSCGEFTICYGSKANTTHARSLTGAAFPCRNDDFFYWAQPEKKATFAVAADSEFLSQLLVLIGSIHKYYKEHPILVYDIGNIAEQKKHLRGILTNIRNVKVVVADDLIPLERSEYANGAFQPFLMIDSLRRFEEVYWMSPLHEIVSDQIMDYPSDTKFTTYIRIGSERLQPHKKLGIHNL
ncbi:hypothetical protein L596_003948 [Steinernema carpocapsae]|uniref:Uncharacterized protein n=1 Tax=Steinernema carpocapsae TaxID=34508 RepID=A0A4U8UU63_STECR|nr:hypothetical protein L596_003948 [Steinernema carpocapsae]